jgi:hypothetical protein
MSDPKIADPPSQAAWAAPAEAMISSADMSSPTVTVELTIAALTPFTEIRLLDARFAPVTLPTNVGTVTVPLRPGIYEVGFRVGDGWQTHSVALQPGVATEPVTQDPAPDAVAPVPSGWAMHTQANVVIDLTQRLASSQLDSAGSALPSADRINVMLIGAEDDAMVPADLSPGVDGIWQFAAAPGYWRLRIDEQNPREPFEIPLAVIEGYAVYLAAPLRETGEGPCVDLERLRFRLPLQGVPLQPLRPDLLDFEDAAYTALGSNRAIYGPELEQLVDRLTSDSASNPVLAMLACHLCDQSRDDDLRFQLRLIEWLEGVTGGPGNHPDVAALRLTLPVDMPGDIRRKFAFPPLLTASWRLVLAATQKNADLIPAGSFSDHIADRVWASSQVVVWTAPPLDAPAPMARAAPQRSIELSLPGDVEAESSFSYVSDDSATIQAGLAHPALLDWLRDALVVERDGAGPRKWEDPDDLSSAELAVAGALFPEAPNERLQKSFKQFADSKKKHSSAQPATLSPAKALEELGLPQATVTRALGSLAVKLTGQAMNRKLKL